MSFDIDRDAQSAYFDIVAKKILYIGPSPVGTVFYRWELYVRPGGLKIDFIPAPKKSGFHYKYHARASSIEVRRFEINGYEVPYYDETTGELYKFGDPRHPDPSDCIDIDSKKNLSGEGAIEVNASDIMFCAGSCSGFLITATNN